MIREMRKCWLPKRREMPEQCASCPFREGNDAELGAVLVKLRSHFQLAEGPVTQEIIDHARTEVRDDLRFSGDFICHFSAYDLETGARRPDGDARQCPGASAFWRGDAP